MSFPWVQKFHFDVFLQSCVDLNEGHFASVFCRPLRASFVRSRQLLTSQQIPHFRDCHQARWKVQQMLFQGGKQRQSKATKLSSETDVEKFPLAHQLMRSKSLGEDAPSLAFLFSSLRLDPLLSRRKNNGSFLPLSIALSEEVACDEDELQPVCAREEQF